jgi:uncharacterized protein involved in exopolysaccharide biosynthesis
MKRKITWKKIAGSLRWQPLGSRERTTYISHGELQVSPRATAHLIYKNLPFLAATTLAIMILTAAALFCLPNSYTSRASILPSGTKDNFSALRELSGIGDPSSSIDENSSVLFPQILRSRQIGQAVIEHEYTVNEIGHERRLTLKGYFKTGISSYLLDKLKRITSITTDKKTGIITLAVETRYPELSQAIAGQYLDRLEHFNLYKRQSSAKQSAAYLERELSRHAEDLAAAEDALEEYQMSNRDWDITRDPEILKTINRMKRDITARMETVLFIRQQYELTRLEVQKDLPIVSVLDPPSLPSVKSGPHRLLTTLMVGPAVFLFLSFLIIARDAIKSPQKQSGLIERPAIKRGVLAEEEGVRS